MSALIVTGNDLRLPQPLGPHQREFLEVCVECFQEGKNGVVELGENMGRSSLLLCSALAFLEQNMKGGLMKHVLYLCGSGEELSNVIGEFKRSSYASMRMVLLNDLDDLKALFSQSNDLLNGTEEKIPEPCIIFSTQELFFQVILSFPSPEYDLKKTLVLIEDAFQIEKTCQIFASLSLCELDGLTKQLQRFEGAEKTIAKLEGLKKVLRSISPNNGGRYDPVFKGMEISNVFQKCNAELDDFDIQYLKEKNCKAEVLHFISITKSFNCHVMTEDIQMTSELIKNYLLAFNMYVTNKLKKQANHSEECQDLCKTLNFLCLEPSILFKIMTDKKPHSIILSSATISPLSQLKTELGLLDAREFIGKSFVEDFQVFARIVKCGPGGQFLELPNSNCLDPGYCTALGQTILNVAKVTPAGVGMTIYFNSDDMFRQLKEHWLEKNKPNQPSLWELIGQEKDIISSASHDDLKQFNANVGYQKGNCIFVVLQKEGLKEMIKNTLILDRQRVVMIIGVPFPPEDDPKVTRKMMYNRERSSTLNVALTGNQYIRWEISKPIRRVMDLSIRSISDYGVILLCDCGFEHAETQPPWLKSKLLSEKRFAEMLNELKEFFKNIQMRMKWIMANAECPGQVDIPFGAVRKWEVEKIKVEVTKLKRNNNRLEIYLQRLRDSIKMKHIEKEELVKKLKELDGRIDEHLHFDIKSEAKCTQPNQPSLVQPSPRKSPYPEDLE